MELARARAQMRKQTMDLTRMNEAFAIVNGADTTVTTFGEGQARRPPVFRHLPDEGRLVLAGQRRGVLYQLPTTLLFLLVSG